MNLRRVFAVAVTAVLVPVLASHAGIVMLGTSGWQAQWDASLDPYVDINLDGQTSDTVFIEKSAEFIDGPGLGNIFPSIAITFRQTGPSTISKIVINDEILTNSTGVDWTDFHFSVIDHNDAWFQGGPDFRFGTSPLTHQVFSTDLHQLTVDGFGLGPNGTDAVVPAGSVWYPGDGYPDSGQLIINVVSRDTLTTFTLKERPSAPEPTSLLLALAALPLIRRRRA